MANLFVPSCEPLNLSLKIFDLLLTIISPSTIAIIANLITEDWLRHGMVS